MGTYLSSPQRSKESTDGENADMKFGISKMQGWKRIQEIMCGGELKFDDSSNLALFTMFEGIGGSEVAEYSMQNFPQYLRLMMKEGQYSDINLDELLSEAFISFDNSLSDDFVPEILLDMRNKYCNAKQQKSSANEDEVSKCQNKDSDDHDDDDDDDDEEDANLLLEEACMPMDELMERYDGTNEEKNIPQDESVVTEAETSSSLPQKHSSIDVHSISNNSEVTSSVSCTNDSNKVDSLQQTNGNNLPDSENQISDEHNSVTFKHVNVDSNEVEGIAETNPVKSNDKTNETETSSRSTLTDNGDCMLDNKLEANKTSSVCSVPESSSSSTTKPVSEDLCEGSSEAQPSSSSGYKRLKNKITSSDTESESDDVDDDDEKWCSDDNTDDDDDDDDDDDIDGELSDCDEITAGHPVHQTNVRFKSRQPCLAVLIRRGSGDLREMYVASSGRLRCILCRSGQALDVVGEMREESEETGSDDVMSSPATLPNKALGFHKYKYEGSNWEITSRPEIRTVVLNDDDEFVVLISDGMWRVLGSQDIISFIKCRLENSSLKFSSVCEELLDMCLAPNLKSTVGCDNMACTIISLRKNTSAVNSAEQLNVINQSILSHKRPASDMDVTEQSEQLSAEENSDETKSRKRLKQEETPLSS